MAEKDTRTHRSERLKSKGTIDRLFKEGEKVGAGKLLLIYHSEEGTGKFRFGTGAPKKRLKKARDRNRSKRVLRELIRAQKDRIKTELGKRELDAELFFLYRGDRPPSYETLRKEMIRLMERWEEKLPDPSLYERGGNAGS